MYRSSKGRPSCGLDMVKFGVYSGKAYSWDDIIYLKFLALTRACWLVRRVDKYFWVKSKQFSWNDSYVDCVMPIPVCRVKNCNRTLTYSWSNLRLIPPSGSRTLEFGCIESFRHVSSNRPVIPLVVWKVVRGTCGARMLHNLLGMALLIC